MINLGLAAVIIAFLIILAIVLAMVFAPDPDDWDDNED